RVTHEFDADAETEGWPRRSRASDCTDSVKQRRVLTSADGSATVTRTLWRGGGAAERAGFENRSARKGRGSSNLPLSVSKPTTFVTYGSWWVCLCAIPPPQPYRPRFDPNTPFGTTSSCPCRIHRHGKSHPIESSDADAVA